MPAAEPAGAAQGVTGAKHDSNSVRRGGASNSLRRTLPTGAALLAATAFVPAVLFSGAAQAAPLAFSAFGALEVTQLAVFAGVMGAALLSAVWLIRERARTSRENMELRGRIADLNALLQRSEALLNAKDQRIVVWGAASGRPEIVGALQGAAGAPEERGAFLAFGRWLSPQSALQLERNVSELREAGRSFDLVAETQSGLLLEIQGRRPGSLAIVRFLSLSGVQARHAQLRLEHQRLSDEHALVLGLAETLSAPFWIRWADGRLKWVNSAYARAADAVGRDAAVQEGREFLGTQTREAIARQHLTAPTFTQTVSTVIAGDRKLFAVADFADAAGSAGMAVDRSETEALREEFEHTLRSHSDTLDQLTTAVAIFDAQQKLRFYNQAFQKLWDLDAVFLNSAPEHALVLDRLRSDGKIAEQPEWRRWKEGVLSAYRSVGSQEHSWHLPDGRFIRVVANPQPKGDVTWVFENLTERIDLESRYNSAVRVQTETLENLAEGVAVFGPDGRIRLANPAFSSLWGLPRGLVGPETHIAEIRATCDARAVASPWADFVAAVTGFDERRDWQSQAELIDGAILHYAVIHLTNGQVMMTFVDVTDTANVERALKEKNEALEKADQLKNDFVQHVSYELRSPLTNIIGFTELLALDSTGPLDPRQRDYVEHIGSSSSVLLTIVNDILDLATVDAGIMELEIGEVPVRQAVEAAAGLVGERLRENAIRLDIEIDNAPEVIYADGNRVRQVLFNLLANAANYAPEQSVIRLTCATESEAVVFSVHDDGPGMPPEVLDTVFKRFQPQPNGGRRRGAGLGLAIVKGFVELHQGTVEIESGHGRGTTVTCRFPLAPERFRTAAE